jgi:3'-5' exoribonuclease
VNAAPLRPADWVGSHPFPWPDPRNLAEGDPFVGCFLVTALYGGRGHTHAAYIHMQLADASGSLEGRIPAEQAPAWLAAGIYAGVRATATGTGPQRHLLIEEIAPVEVDALDLQLFIPTSARDPAEMEAELNGLIGSIDDEALRTLLEELLDARMEVGRAFRISPAAKQNHHACARGLLEHTLSVAHICSDLARHYGNAVDRDLLIAAALLHDVGKTRELSVEPGFPYTDEGKLLGHILLGLQIVAETAALTQIVPSERLLLLEHLIASHQGRYEWQSPREPRMLEGLLLHYADDLDAKMNQAQALLEQVTSGWTPYDRSLGREFLKHAPPPTET